MAFAETPELVGALVRLRSPLPADVERLQQLMADSEVSILTGSTHSSTAEPTASWSVAQLQRIYQGWAADRDRHVWAIVERATDAVVGEVVLLDLDEGNRSCGFRIWISGSTGRGLGTEATGLVLRHA